MSPDIYDHIVKETVRYATASRNKLDFVFNVDELKSLIGILLLSSYHKLPSVRHYWAKDEDLVVSIVKKAMSRKKFQGLKSVVHFCDNADAENNKGDKGFKVRSLISKLRKSFIQHGLSEECISVDEMRVKYYGHNSLKQFIQVKPIRFGYKLWALCGTSGYCYNFDLYCGTNPQLDKNDEIALGSKVVLKMLEAVADPESHTVFFDNYFTGYELFSSPTKYWFSRVRNTKKNRLSVH
ncbi:piggyBac transposable element-derived protein 3-like [Macrobrachium rosenbergii]|uniref:piggyBac transposable element-derived protein 3-like n=1 Tax=Macrobrachium rosenbergii TaxID=79674 RepID=UPI0034D65EAA